MLENALAIDSASPPRVLPRIARLGDRAFAAILDAIIPSPFIWNYLVVLGSLVKPTRVDGEERIVGGPALLAVCLMCLTWMLYMTVSERWFGTTIGKQIMGIEVRSADGRRIGWVQAITRNAIRLVDVIGFYATGFLIAMWSKESQRFGDHLAHTVVVESDGSHRKIGLLIGAAAFASGWLLLDTLGRFFPAAR